jgi:hypothetical protein
MTAAPATRYVYLASNAYSGSTLLSALLGAHPQIATVSDVSGTRRQHRMGSFACSCGLPMRDDPFWLAVQDAMRSRGWPDFELGNFRLGFDYGSSPLFNRLRTGTLRWTMLERGRDAAFSFVPADQRRMRRIGTRAADFAQVVADLNGGARAFVDASKERLRARYLDRYLPAPLRVIHLVRDVRAVVASTRRHPSGAGSDAEDAARSWAATNEAILRSVQQLPADRRHLVRYEDLATATDSVLRRAYAFCGVDPNVEPDLDLPQHLLGNRVRTLGVGEVAIDRRWREELTTDEQDAAMAAAGATYWRFYPVPPD